jgi:flagellin
MGSYSILTNIASLQAMNYLQQTSNFQNKTIQEVTSGLRIVNAGDDAAGLAVANGLRNDQAVLTQGVLNANDGLATLQTVDGGISNIGDLLDRATTLATQSASGTFTGDRSVLNSEFQSVLGEIDRQAQSIGLDTGGQFAQNLSVFIGGGKANNGISAITNGSVSVNLAGSTVDTKSLGLMGAQAAGDAVDIGSASNTSVANILADTRNTTATAGYTDFYFAGAGFSGANAVEVAVNTQNVSDTASLVTAINAAIQSAGEAGTQAGTAFKNAGIVASVKQNSDGTQQLAFTSSSAAFQVQAGDKMANALMGNVQYVGQVATTQGVAMNTTTVTGSAATLSGNTAIANPAGITFQFLGAGMAQPVNITLGANSTTVTTAIADLSSQVANNAALQAAGITLTSATAGSPLVFSSARGEQFTVQASGDTADDLGFGSFQKNALNQFDYNQLQAAGTYNPAAAVPSDAGTATLQFSINGAASNGNAVAINLGLGDAQAASVTSGALGATTSINAGNNQLNVALDGTIHNVTLTNSTPATAATLAAGNVDLTGGITIAAATSGTESSADLTSGVAVTSSADILAIKVDGGPTQTFTLATATGQHASDIAGQLTGLIGATASAVGGHLVITSNSTGTTSGIQILAPTDSADTLLGFPDNNNHTGTNGNNQMTIATDGGASKTITLTSTTYASSGAGAAALAADINTQYGSNIASVDANHHLVLASTTTGAGSAITLTNPAANSAYTTLGIAADAGTTAHGTAASDRSAQEIASDISSQLGGGVTVQVGTSGAITIQSANKGAAESIQVLAGNANATLGWAAAGGAITYGVNRSAADLTNALNQAFSANQNLQNAGLVASYNGGTNQFTITSSNGTMFRVDAMGGTTAAAIQGNANVATGGNFNLTGNNTLTINGQAVTLTNGNMTASQIQQAIANTTGTGVTASVVTVGGRDYLKLVSTATGSAASIAVTGSAATVLGLASSAQGTDASFGYGTGGATFAGNTATASSAAMFEAGGESATSDIAFQALQNGSDQQAITISASDASGTQQSKTITLQNISTDRSGRSLDEAISAINTKLQQSDNSTLQSIVAVKTNDNGSEGIKFVSSLNSFTVSIGNTATGDGLGDQGTTVTSSLAAGGATADISTQASASAAVSALSAAVTTLGSAQATVGKGENEFTYAINLAQSQLTNEAAAESQIRDADLATEAANLTKAQILQQAGMAALAQANSAPQAVLTLLRT